jgi:gamma-glutamylputrescine oxidase
VSGSITVERIGSGSPVRPALAQASPMTDARSWYQATAAYPAVHPPLAGQARHDVVVVGGGFTGLTTAIELAERGMDVALVEAHTIGWGASGRNGGQVVTGFSKSLNYIRKLVGEDDTRCLWQMAEEGKRLVHERIKRHNIGCDYTPGFMYTAVKPAHVAWLQDMLESWQRLGYKGASWLNREQTRSLVDCPYYLGGIKDEENGHLHPLSYALGLGRAARDAGVTIYENTLVAALEDGPATRLKTPNGEIEASFVVLCGNALLGPISRDVARYVNAQIVPVATYMVATEPMSQTRAEEIIPGNIAVSDIMFVVNYYRRTRDHRLLFGGGLDWSGLTVRDVGHRMRRAMYKWLPGSRNLAIEYCWGGYVDMTMSMLPSLGRLSKNVFYVHGFSGNGITLTAIAGRLAAEAVAGTAERFDVFARLPNKPFPGGPLLKKPVAVAGALWYKLKDLLP